ncbi:hypothetical protein DFAR_360010 [Desulfarculales bacterium]
MRICRKQMADKDLQRLSRGGGAKGLCTKREVLGEYHQLSFLLDHREGQGPVSASAQTLGQAAV